MTASNFRHVGGDLFFGTSWLSDEEAERQLDLFLREHDACLRIGDRIGSRVARSAFLSLTDAIKSQSDWKRCAASSYPLSRKDAA